MDCLLSKVEIRLNDCINLWRKANQFYFHPEEFRININACIQNLRSVTFILQKEKSKLSDFEKWYSGWQDIMKSDQVLKWLVDARNRIVKEGDLQTKSYAQLAIIDDWFEPPIFEAELSPFLTSEELAYSVIEVTPKEQIKDHSILRVTRKWIDSNLPNYEILEALSNSIKVFISLLVDAHSTFISNESLINCFAFQEYSSFQGGIPTDLISSEWERILWMDLNTKQILTPALKVFERDEALLKEAQNHYKFGNEIREIGEAKNIIEEAKALFRQAKVILAKDGNHTNIAILTLQTGEKQILNLLMENRTEKYLMFRELANTIKKLDAIAVIFIGEIWLGKYDESEPNRPAEYDPERKEALVTIGFDKVGNHITCLVPFVKNGNIIEFGDENYSEEEEITNFTLPIKKVWYGK